MHTVALLIFAACVVFDAAVVVIVVKNEVSRRRGPTRD